MRFSTVTWARENELTRLPPRACIGGIGPDLRQVELRHPRLLPGLNIPGHQRHSDTSLYISLVILYPKYTGWRQNDVNVYA